ncbi:hypothetical protein ACIQZB_25425 [Streptomyces sp. NPDC097727]|uniref:hypothetical protein n=1 Tax=Streptomyces sp. NPDC097727 TaxID=3366092 RepID=UPI00382B6CFC
MAELLESEREDRDERRELRRVKKANFPRDKRIEDFDFSKNPHVPLEVISTSPPGSRSATRSEREERHAIAIASNRPFTEWDQTFTDKRLCQAGSMYEVLAGAASGRSW